MREMSVAEQRYLAVLAVIKDGETVKDVAARFGVRRQTVHEWLAKYEAGGLDGLGDRSHRPRSCPHQIPGEVEAAIARLRSSHPGWGPRRIVYELARAGVEPCPSESAVYRALVRLNLIDQLGHTSVPGVYAAGDPARFAELPMPIPSVLAAAAAGQTAGAAVVPDLAAPITS